MHVREKKREKVGTDSSKWTRLKGQFSILPPRTSKKNKVEKKKLIHLKWSASISLFSIKKSPKGRPEKIDLIRTRMHVAAKAEESRIRRELPSHSIPHRLHHHYPTRAQERKVFNQSVTQYKREVKVKRLPLVCRLLFSGRAGTPCGRARDVFFFFHLIV